MVRLHHDREGDENVRKTVSLEQRKKISESLKAYFKENRHPRQDKTLSEESRKKLSESMTKRYSQNPQLRKNLSINNGMHREEVNQRRIATRRMRMRQGLIRDGGGFRKGHRFQEDVELRRIKSVVSSLRNRPTNLERNMMAIIQKHDLPLQYVGDGRFWIGHMNPDFISIYRGLKICVEVSNRVFRDEQTYAQPRIAKFKKFGWNCIVFFGSGKNDCDLDENMVLETLKPLMQRALGVLFKVGGLLTYPEPLAMADRSQVITEEPQTLQG